MSGQIVSVTDTGEAGAARYSFGYSSTGATSFTPSDLGFKGWTFDPCQVQAGTIMPTGGLLQLAKIKIPEAGLITNLHLHITVPGATLTAGRNFAGLFSTAGVLLSATDDQTTAWASGGFKTMVLATAQQVLAGFAYVGWYATGGTLPTMSRGINSASAITNAGLSAPDFRWASADSGLTTALPDPFGTQTGTATAYWAAAS